MTTVDGLKAAIERLTHIFETLNTARIGGFQVPPGQIPMFGGHGFSFGSPQNMRQKIDEDQEMQRRETADRRHNQRMGPEAILGEMGSMLSWGGLSLRRIAGHGMRLYQKLEQAKISRDEEMQRRDIWDKRQQEKKMNEEFAKQDAELRRDQAERRKQLLENQKQQKKEMRRDHIRNDTPQEDRWRDQDQLEAQHKWELEAQNEIFGQEKASVGSEQKLKKEALAAGAKDVSKLKNAKGAAGVVSVVADVVLAFVKLTKAALDAAKDVGEMAKEMSKVSPVMAYISQQKEIRDIQRTQRKAELIAPSASRLLDEEAKFKDQTMRFEVIYEDLKNNFFEGILDSVNKILKMLNDNFGGTEPPRPTKAAIDAAEEWAKNRR